jgi:hypothetical protein
MLRLDVFCDWVTGCRHDLRSKVMQFSSLTASLPTKLVETLVGADRFSGGEDPFCLLDYNARVQCCLELNGALEQEGRGIVRLARLGGEQVVVPFTEPDLTSL